MTTKTKAKSTTNPVAALAVKLRAQRDIAADFLNQITQLEEQLRLELEKQGIQVEEDPPEVIVNPTMLPQMETLKERFVPENFFLQRRPARISDAALNVLANGQRA